MKTRGSAKAASKNVVEAGATPPPQRPRSRFSGVPAGLRVATQVLDTVKSVRTIYPDFDRRIRVGGLPVRRIHTVHGPTHGGKTAYVIGLIASFLAGGHPVLYIDAEFSTPLEFVRQLVEQVLGRKLEEVDGFFVERPKSYEDIITKVDEFLKWMVAQVANDPDLCCLIVVDSINKLTPKRELEQMLADLRQAGKGEEGGEQKKSYGGRGKKSGDAINKGWGRVRAGLNQAWLDHLTPLLHAANCAFVPIAQERDDDGDEKAWEKDMMDTYAVKGGRALLFDASCVIRITKVKAIRENPSVEGSPIIAWEHRARIWKSKVGAMDGRHTDTTFHLQLSGGFDLTRDLVDTAKDLGVISLSGSWYSWMPKGRAKGVRKQGLPQMSALLTSDRELLLTLQAQVSEAIDKESGRGEAA